MSRHKLPNKQAREKDRVLRALGYSLTSDAGGHFAYDHPNHDTIWVAGTPRTEGLGRFFDELRKRHGHDHPLLARQTTSTTSEKRRKAAARSRSKERARQARALHSVQDTRPEPVELVRVEESACVECGRRWASDLNPAGRRCPGAIGGPYCGGEILVAGTYVPREQAA